jgi:hypothetical protein
VPGPGLNLKIDGNQSFQTNAEKWAQSEATEINSLIQSCENLHCTTKYLVYHYSIPDRFLEVSTAALVGTILLVE